MSQSQSQTTTFYLSVSAMFAALICILTAFIFHIPFGINGGYLHFGDTLIYLAASLLPLPYALGAAAIGGMMADLLTAPVWIPATLLIKMLLVLPFTSKEGKIITRRNIFAIFAGFFICVLGYYLAEVVMFGNMIALIPASIGNVIQATGSGLFYLILGTALDQMNFKKRI